MEKHLEWERSRTRWCPLPLRQAGSRGEGEGGVRPVTAGEVAGGGNGGRVCAEVTLRAGGASTGSTSMSAGETGGCGEDDNGAFNLDRAAASGGVGSGEAGTGLKC